jgi:hypothetical protein
VNLGTAASTGGSGGGGVNNGASASAAAAGTSLQGNAGGIMTNTAPNYGCGGGGGAGAVGGNGTTTTGGSGGIGLANAITGTLKYYAGGGGGGVAAGGAPGLGGLGGGGSSLYFANGGAGTPNTGGGGSGTSGPTTGATTLIGGVGGSGIVIVRYVAAQVLASPYPALTPAPGLNAVGTGSTALTSYTAASYSSTSAQVPTTVASAAAITTTGTTTLSSLSTGNTQYNVVSFTTNGSFITTVPLTCDILVVAGGGAGGHGFGTGSGGNGGGGGAGAVQLFMNQSLTPGTYTVTVGSGGVSGAGANLEATAAGNSQFGTLTASQGGGSGGWLDSAYSTNRNGGNGGGAHNGNNPGISTQKGGYVVNGGGFNGGTTYVGGYYMSGGGGGAGGPGLNGIPGANLLLPNGGGGPGWVDTYFGTGVTYGVGGSASLYNGGVGGAGAAASANTGSGGGGGYNGYAGGNGGSGIVIIRYVTSESVPTTTSYQTAITPFTTYNVHTFNNSGTFTIPGTSPLTCDILVVGGGGGGGAAVTPDPYFGYVTLLLHADGNTNDSSSYSYTLTSVNGTVGYNTNAKFGASSFSFSGNGSSGNYLETAKLSSFMFGTNNFTIEFWFYPTSVTQANHLVGNFNTNEGGITTNNDWYISLASTAYVNFYFAYNGTSFVSTFAGSHAVSVNTWYHYALVRNGSVFTGYLNGQQDGTLTSSASLDNGTSTQYFNVGCSGVNQTTAPFNGLMDDIRVTNGFARYTTNFTPPTSAFPSPPVQQYPPASLTVGVSGTQPSTTAISGMPYGNGTYTANASSYFASDYAYLAFDKLNPNNLFWASSTTTGTYSQNAPYTYSGSGGASTTDVNAVQYKGEWLQLQMPASIVLTSYSISPVQSATNVLLQSPATFWVLGSNNGTTWYVIDTRTNVSWTTTTPQTFMTNTNTTAYSYYRLVVNQVNGYYSAAPVVIILQWMLFSGDSLDGGAACSGGGGGAGGVQYFPAQTLTPGLYTVTVGAGGTAGVSASGATSATNDGGNGGNSQFGTLPAAIGGGGGTGSPALTANTYHPGGSGGGGVATASGNIIGGYGTFGQGYSGGTGSNYSGYYGGGGGGGAGGIGGTGTSNVAGAGGIGVPNSITGALTYYAGGGAGGFTASSSITSAIATGGAGGGGGSGLSAQPNTGGGGGGGSSIASGLNGGAGGSGVVIVRYATNTPIVYPLDNLSTAALAYAQGLYAPKRLLTSYTGPVMQLRNSGTGAISDFYADQYTTLWTGPNQTGQPFGTWAGTYTCYVVVWYDQSGKNNHATQPTLSAQPAYNNSSNVVDFSLVSNTMRMQLPNSTFPTGDTSYTITFKHGNIPTLSTPGYNGFYGAGTANSTNGYNLACGVWGITGGNSFYKDYWWGIDMPSSTIPITAGNYITCEYTSSGTSTVGTNSRQIYVNGTLNTQQTSSGVRVTQSGNNYIGFGDTFNNDYLNGQLYYLTIFSTALSAQDRVLAESIYQTFPLDTLTGPTKQSIRGVFSLRALFTQSQYFPVVLIQNSAASASAYFYGNVNGTALTTGINGAGVTLQAWLLANGGGLAYVATWYDQSYYVNGSATQYNATATGTQRPFINTQTVPWSVDMTTNNTYFNLVAGTIPMNGSYTFSVKIGNPVAAGNGILGAGTVSTNNMNCLRTNGGTGLDNYFYLGANDCTYSTATNFPSPSVTTVITYPSSISAPTATTNTYYTGGTTSITYTTAPYINGVTPPTTSTTSRTTWNGISGGDLLGKDPADVSLQTQMYWAFISSAAICSNDRLVLEAIDTTYPLDTVSAAGIATANALFSCKRVISSYKGPVLNLRSSAGYSDFYADKYGNLWTGPNSTGTSFQTWIGSGTAYVAIWYDQSGKGKNAYQTTTTSQPSYNPILKLLDFSTPNASAYLLCPTFTFPQNNTSQTVVHKVGTFNPIGGSENDWWVSGTCGTSGAPNIMYLAAGKYSWSQWGGTITTNVSPVAGDVITFKITIGNANPQVIYQNNNVIGQANLGASGSSGQTALDAIGTGRNNTGTPNQGNYGSVNPFNGQFYYISIFTSSLSSADQVIVQSQ